MQRISGHSAKVGRIATKKSARVCLLALGVVGVLAAPLMAVAPAGASSQHSESRLGGQAADDGPLTRYVIRSNSAGLAALRKLMVTAGGNIVRTLGGLDTVIADLPASAVAMLNESSLVVSMVADGSVVLLDPDGSADRSQKDKTEKDKTEKDRAKNGRDDPVPAGSGPIGDFVGEAGSMFRITRAIGAQTLWGTGFDGSGVDIAVIDTGVAPVEGLAGKVINGPDLSLDVPYTSLFGMDAYGHGTHMAGIAAGLDATGSSLTDPNRFVGVAPGSRIVNVKVGAFDGAVDVSQVIAAVDWVVQHRQDNGMNIRVLNLSYGTRSTLPYQDDPLAWAAEVAWRNGIVVVAAAGNDGGSSPIASPAYNPRVIAVGAVDQSRKLTAADFVSGNRTRQPDMFAPGAHVLSLRVPGSYVDSRFPTARRGTRLFAGTGTSQATAVVSGAAALLLSAHPGASPDQIKMALARSGRDVAGAVGDFIQVQKANDDLERWGDAPSITDRMLSGPPRGTGSLEASRGDQHLVADGVVLDGERDIMGQPWNGARWAQGAWNGVNWTGGDWNGVNWTGVNWTGVNWTGVNWTGVNWTGVNWTSMAWAGVNWTDVNWTGVNWTGVNWTGVNWTGVNWTGVNWTSTGNAGARGQLSGAFSGVNWSESSWQGAVWG